MEHELGTDPKKWSVFILKQVGSWSGLWEGKEVYRGWLGVSTKIWNHLRRVQCQLEMPSLSRHLFVDEFARRQIPSSAGVISLLGCTCFL